MLEKLALHWSLFGSGYLAGSLIAALMGLLGILVVSRNQIFLGAAMSQASTLGIASALFIAELVGSNSAAWLTSDFFLSSTAVIGPALTVLLIRRSFGNTEALTGLVFLLGSSLSMLLLSFSPHGLEEISRIQSSSLIGAKTSDAYLFCILLIISSVFVYRAFKSLVLALLDAEMAQTIGINCRRWEMLISIWLAVSIGLAIRVAGVTFVFGALVIPGMLGSRFARNPKQLFLFAPLIAFSVAASSFLVANLVDLPPGQLSTALLSIAMLLALLIGPRQDSA